MRCRHCGVDIVLRRIESTGPVWIHERSMAIGSLFAWTDRYRVCRAVTVAEPEGAQGT